MAKNNFQNFWIDAFNLFHRWHKTSALFKSLHENPQNVHTTALQALSSALGKTRNRTTAFMDGGVSRHNCTISGIKVRYPGPGKHADDLLEEAARASNNNRATAVITSDNFLAATMRRNGAKILSCEKFIRDYLSNSHQAEPKSENKPPLPNESEVEEWLKIFEEEE